MIPNASVPYVRICLARLAAHTISLRDVIFIQRECQVSLFLPVEKKTSTKTLLEDFLDVLQSSTLLEDPRYPSQPHSDSMQEDDEEKKPSSKETMTVADLRLYKRGEDENGDETWTPMQLKDTLDGLNIQQGGVIGVSFKQEDGKSESIGSSGLRFR